MESIVANLAEEVRRESEKLAKTATAHLELHIMRQLLADPYFKRFVEENYAVSPPGYELYDKVGEKYAKSLNIHCSVFRRVKKADGSTQMVSIEDIVRLLGDE